jgi:hypothetical protein
MWPIHGHYQCRVCGRQYSVEWAEPPASQKSGRRRTVPSLRSAILPALILAVLFGQSIPSPAATAPATKQAAEAVLERFTGSQDEAVRWPLETIEIEASLPTLAKRGRLSAVRRLLPAGHPKYEVVESDGDATVRREVIVRYLSADARATELPAPSVAMTSANYKFDFVGAFPLDHRMAYAFYMTPRQKRQGLLKGVVWLGRLDGIGAERAADLAVTPDPRGEHEPVDHGEVIEGQPGLFASHLDPDGLLGLAVVVDRVQAHGPDRLAVPRGRLPLLVLVVLLRLGRAGHAELDAVRLEFKSHDVALLVALRSMVTLLRLFRPLQRTCTSYDEGVLVPCQGRNSPYH